jgi:AcrR family transcriptional regulator
MVEANKPRRRGTGNTEARAAIVDAAERLILEEGYAAVTTRKLASKAGLKSQLVHYYFESIDDVFIAVIRRRANRNLQRTVELINDDHPFDPLWSDGLDKEAACFWQELLALANHRKAIQDEIKHYMEQRRHLQAAALERSLKRNDIKSKTPPIAWALLVGGISHILTTETMLGLSFGHKETLELMHAILDSALTGKTPEVADPK